MSADLATLQQQAERAARKATEAQAQADSEAARVESERAARLEEWDRRALEHYDADALEAAEREAFRAFEEALLNDPAFAAWLTYRTAHAARQQRAIEAQSTASRLGLHASRILVPGQGLDDMAAAVRTVLEQEARRAAEDEVERRWTERERHGDGSQVSS